jgi:hypothetical protein
MPGKPLLRQNRKNFYRLFLIIPDAIPHHVLIKKIFPFFAAQILKTKSPMATNDNRISAVLSSTDKQDILDAFTLIRTKMPFLVNLLPDERLKKRKTGTKRKGYVLGVYKGAQSFPTTIPSSFNMGEWDKDETLVEDIKEIFDVSLNLHEALDDTLLQMGFERIKQADEVYGYLKNAARGNASVSALVTTIGQAFLGQGRRTEATIIDLVPSGGRGVVNAVLNSYLVNEGETLLKIVMENGSRTLSLRPGDAV